VPGDYRAWFIPTSPGTYSFHFTGRIKGTPFNQTFTSGPQTFADVKDPMEAEFPVQAPTNQQLAQRVVAEANRQGAAIAAVRGHADSQVRTARFLAVVGLVLALLGIGVGIGGVQAGRKAGRAIQMGNRPAPASERG
jgi:hypothetical protein